MPTPRIGALLLAGAVTVLATGCALTRLSAQPPAHIGIAGDWKVDWAHSDPLPPVLAQIAAQTLKAEHARRRFESEQAGGGRQREGGGEGDGDEGPGGEGSEGGEHPRQGRRAAPNPAAPVEDSQQVGGPVPDSSAMRAFLASVPVGDYLRLVPGPDAFTVIAGDLSSQYTPGVESVIESSSGEATQISGWKHGAYVIDTRPQLGPRLIERFELTDHHQLALTIHLHGFGTDVTFRRLYDRTNRIAPLAPPTNN